MKLEGGCYCKAVRFRAEGEPVLRGQCCCRECQYSTGGQPNIIIGMPEGGFHYTQQPAKTFQRKDLPNPVTREFCGECGTQLLTRSPGLPGVVLIKVGSLDDPSVFGKPDMIIFTIDKQSFHHIPEGVPAFERIPGR